MTACVREMVMALAVVGPACAPAADGDAPTVRMERLGSLGDGVDVAAAWREAHPGENAGRWRWAHVVRDAGRAWVVVDGKPGHKFQAIKAESLASSPAAAHYYYVASEKGKERAVIDGTAGPAFDAVEAESFRWDPTGEHYVYVAHAGQQRVAVADGRAGVRYTWLGRRPEPFGEEESDDPDRPPRPLLVLARVGGRFAYPAARGGKIYMVVDGKQRGPYTDIDTPVFSADGRRLAYAARVGERWCVIVDGRAGREWDAVDKPVFSPDGKRVAYLVKRGEDWHAVVDGEWIESKGAYRLVFSPDSRRLACALGDGKGCRVVVDGARSDLHPDIGEDPFCQVEASPAFTPDSKHCVYVVRDSRDDPPKGFLVKDGKRGPLYEQVRRVQFSPVGGRIAYEALRGEQVFMVVDGKPYGPYDGNSCTNRTGDWETNETMTGPAFAFSPDGKRVAFVARTGQGEHAVIDGQAQPGFSMVSTPSFSANSKHWMYAAWQDADADADESMGEVWVVRDGKTVAKHALLHHDLVWLPTLSADGLHVAYALENEQTGKYSVWLDGKPGPEFNAWMSPLRLRSDGALEYLVRRNGALVRVVHGPRAAKMPGP